MEFNKISLSVFSIFALILFVGLASAENTVLTSTNTTSLTTSATAGSTATFKFNVIYTGSSTETTVKFLSDISAGLTLPPDTVIPKDVIGREFIVTYNVPSTASSSISFIVKIGSSGTSNTDDFPVTININQPVSSTLDIIPSNTGITKSKNGTFTIKNNGNSNSGAISLTSSSSLITFSPLSPGSLSAGATSQQVNAVLSGDISSFKFGSNPITITASAGSTSDTETFNIVKSFCKNGEVSGNLTIKDIDISSTGDHDEEWKYLDEVTIDVEVENPTDKDVEDVDVVIALYDSNGNNIARDLDFTSTDEERVNVGDINDDDSETATFEFKVPADVSSGSYRLAVKAFSRSDHEENVCADTLDNNIFQSVDIKREDDEGKFIAFDDITLDPIEATCGERVTLDTNVFNIGEDDEDQVRVNLMSKDLNIDQSFEIRNNLDKGDKEGIQFIFDIPQDAEDKIYTLSLSSEYDYRNGVYREGSDEDIRVAMKVIGCSVQAPITGRVASISASLDSDAKAGEQLVITSTIKNLGNSQATFAIGAEGYSDWASLDKISDRILTLGAGESQDVTLTFNVNKDVSGEQSFTLVAESEGRKETREVSVSIEGSSSADLSSLFKGSTLIWVIAVVNVLLIVLIIVIAVRVAKR